MTKEIEERKAGLLTITKLRRVALVSRGANQHAHIVLTKSADIDPVGPRTDPATGQPEPSKGEPMSQTQVFGEIEKKAAEVRKSDPSLTREQAIVKAADEHPDLVESYRDAVPDFEPAAAPEPREPDDFDKANYRIMKAAEGSAEYALAMSERCALLGHDDEARIWREIAS